MLGKRAALAPKEEVALLDTLKRKRTGPRRQPIDARHALLIGKSRATPLRNPENDIKIVARRRRKSGFAVTRLAKASGNQRHQREGVVAEMSG